MEIDEVDKNLNSPISYFRFRGKIRIMEPIKFRGKTHNGVWVYGYYEFDERLNFHLIRSNRRAQQVVPETVGQFTGLLDKNGIEIYEGDIVSVNDFINLYSSSYIGIAIMKGCQWCIKCYKEHGCCSPLFFDDFSNIETEVIGNVFDNPELLEGDNFDKR